MKKGDGAKPWRAGIFPSLVMKGRTEISQQTNSSTDKYTNGDQREMLYFPGGTKTPSGPRKSSFFHI
jgi:hypothetical protein